MSENNQVRRQYQNIPSANVAPNNYRSPTNEIPSDEPLIMIPIRKEIQEVSRRQNRKQSMSRYITVFFLGIIFGLLIFLLSSFLWNHFQSKTSIEANGTNSTCRKRLIGYYAGTENRNITEKQIDKLTHIIFNGVKIQSDGAIEFKSDIKKALFLDMKNKANAMKSEVKIMFSTDAYLSNSKIMSPVLADSKKRKTWINSITSFIVDHQIDGVELFFRWPNTKEDKKQYILFCRELKYDLEKMKKRLLRKSPYLISILSPDNGWTEDNEMDLHELLECADFLNIETDNYYGPWHVNGGPTGPVSPLYSSKGQNKKKSIDWTLSAYTCKTKMPSRFNIVIPFRAALWKNVGNPVIATDEMYRTAETTNNKAEGGAIAWRDLEKEGWKITSAVSHNDSMTPYIWDSNNRKLLTFDNENSLKEKMKYAIEKNLGGVALFELEYDDDSNTLLNAVTFIDLCSGKQSERDEIKYNCEDLEAEINNLPN